MANFKREITYSCYEGEYTGCPTHKGTIEFQSESHFYHFNMNGKDYYFEQGELQAMIDLIKSLNRADTVDL